MEIMRYHTQLMSCENSPRFHTGRAPWPAAVLPLSPLRGPHRHAHPRTQESALTRVCTVSGIISGPYMSGPPPAPSSPPELRVREVGPGRDPQTPPNQTIAAPYMFCLSCAFGVTACSLHQLYAAFAQLYCRPTSSNHATAVLYFDHDAGTELPQ